MLKLFKYLLITSILQSCNSNQQNPKIATKKQATVLSRNSDFDLEVITFKENPSKLYAKNILNSNDYSYDAERDGKLTDEMLQYKISNIITDFMDIEIPKNFGYHYRSPELDSIAKFKNIYFNSLFLLTNINKKPIAFCAETTFTKAGERKKKLDEIRKKLGSPDHSFFLDRELDQCAYEWIRSDRTIQIKISSGFTITANSNGETKKEMDYSLDILIIANTYKNEIYNAHKYEFPDKILYDGKYHSYKEFQFEKNNVFGDNFLLISSNEIYLKEEFGQYNIIKATDDSIIF